MKVLVDALSVNNLSGAYVLRGHLTELVEVGAGHQFVLLTHRRNTHVAAGFPSDVEHVVAGIDGSWMARALWCQLELRRLCKSKGVDCVLSPAGLMTPGCKVAQVVLAQNPWPLVAASEGLRGWRLRIQTRAFGRAQRKAHVMVFNSSYMQQLYTDAFGPPSGRQLVAYQGLSDAHFSVARRSLPLNARKRTVLAVSAMARHKDIGTLLDAFARVCREMPEARLLIAGGWPDAQYRAEIDAQVARLQLGERVQILGHVSDRTLAELYGSSRVFCLPSRCESFGIPALEAQAFGTPCVVARGTAAPEVIGEGGLAVPQRNPAELADALRRLLCDDAEWLRRSSGARANVERFHWRDCSRPLIAAIGDLEIQIRGGAEK